MNLKISSAIVLSKSSWKKTKKHIGNVSGWQLTLIDVAASLDMIDRKVLREEPNTNGIEN